MATDTAQLTTQIDLVSAGFALAKIPAEVPFRTFSTPVVVHTVDTYDAAISICGLDVTKADWTDGGQPCVVCSTLEDGKVEVLPR